MKKQANFQLAKTNYIIEWWGNTPGDMRMKIKISYYKYRITIFMNIQQIL